MRFRFPRMIRIAGLITTGLKTTPGCVLVTPDASSLFTTDGSGAQGKLTKRQLRTLSACRIVRPNWSMLTFGSFRLARKTGGPAHEFVAASYHVSSTREQRYPHNPRVGPLPLRPHL